jgi:hypothetical protein
VFATFRQKFASRLLAQVLQHVQLLIELFGSPACPRFGNLLQPLAAMARIVNIPAGTGDRPTAIQGFQSIHDPGKIFDHGQITARQFSEHAHAGFAVVHGLEIMQAQSLGKFAGIDLVTLVTLLEERDLAWIADQNLANMRLEQVVQPGSPAKNSSMVDAFVSRIDSITTLPWESITAAEIVA